jgi:hypothetical protein
LQSRFRISPEINARNEEFSRRFVLADRAPVRVVCATARAAGKVLRGPVNGWITLTEKPGLGLELNEDAVKEYKVA